MRGTLREKNISSGMQQKQAWVMGSVCDSHRFGRDLLHCGPSGFWVLLWLCRPSTGGTLSCDAWGSSRSTGQGKNHGCVPPAKLTFQQRLREVTGYLQQGSYSVFPRAETHPAFTLLNSLTEGSPRNSHICKQTQGAYPRHPTPACTCQPDSRMPPSRDQRDTP